MQHDIEIPKYRKQPSKKPFKIEYRCVGLTIYKDWRTNSCYKTAKQRDQALHNLQSKRHYGVAIFAASRQKVRDVILRQRLWRIKTTTGG